MKLNVATGPAVLCLLATLVAAACSSANTSLSTPGVTSAEDTLTIALGASATTKDGSLRLTFVELVSESRCPFDVVCVWQGDAAVKIAAKAQGPVIEGTIHTGVDPRTMVVNGYQLSLLDVRPYPGKTTSSTTKSVAVHVVRLTR